MSSTNSKAIICIGYGMDENGKIIDDVKKAQGPRSVEDGVLIKVATHNIVEEDGKLYRKTLNGETICEITDKDKTKKLKDLMKGRKKTTRKESTKTTTKRKTTKKEESKGTDRGE